MCLSWLDWRRPQLRKQQSLYQRMIALHDQRCFAALCRLQGQLATGFQAQEYRFVG